MFLDFGFGWGLRRQALSDVDNRRHKSLLWSLVCHLIDDISLNRVTGLARLA